MRENFGLDRVIEHGTTPLPETTVIVNPARRRLEADLRRHRASLLRAQAQFGALALPAAPTAEQTDAFLTQGGKLREAIAAQTVQLEARKAQRAETPRKVTLKDLPAAERFAQLCPESKHFIDTIKMIAYRAETALVGLLRPHLKKEEEARALIRELFVSSADFEPNAQENTLTIRIHRMASPAHDKAMASLLADLTQINFRHPETGMRLIYTLA